MGSSSQEPTGLSRDVRGSSCARAEHAVAAAAQLSAGFDVEDVIGGRQARRCVGATAVTSDGTPSTVT